MKVGLDLGEKRWVVNFGGIMNKKYLVVLMVASVTIVLLAGCVEEKPIPVTPTPEVSPTPMITPKISPTPLPPLDTKNLIPFESLDKGNSLIAGIEKPTIFVAGSLDEIAQFKILDANILQKIQKVDFSKTQVVGVLRGKMNTGGYGITVQTVSLTKGVVQLKVNFTNPSPDQMVTQVISYPYHIILIPREKLDTPEIWAMYDEKGGLLAQIKLK